MKEIKETHRHKRHKDFLLEKSTPYLEKYREILGHYVDNEIGDNGVNVMDPRHHYTSYRIKSSSLFSANKTFSYNGENFVSHEDAKQRALEDCFLDEKMREIASDIIGKDLAEHFKHGKDKEKRLSYLTKVFVSRIGRVRTLELFYSLNDAISPNREDVMNSSNALFNSCVEEYSKELLRSISSMNSFIRDSTDDEIEVLSSEEIVNMSLEGI